MIRITKILLLHAWLHLSVLVNHTRQQLYKQCAHMPYGLLENFELNYYMITYSSLMHPQRIWHVG